MEQLSTTHAVGKDVLSFCNKCNLTLSHTIMCMMDNQKIAKVKCKTCQAEHKFKDPNTGKKASSTTKKASSKKSSSHEEMSQGQNFWEQAIKNSSATPKAYSIRSNFNVGDLIDHSTFGIGVVESKLEGDKIQVVFKIQSKTLIHNK